MTALNKTENCIDTVIFDIGRVLVDFQPDIPLNRHVPDPGLRSRLKAAVYSNPAWSEADRGLLPEEEIIARFVAADPSLEKEIRAAYDWSWETIRLFPYTEDWIRSLKSRGFRVFCLSNYSRRLRETTDRELRFLSLVDGVLFSYACGLLFYISDKSAQNDNIGDQSETESQHPDTADSAPHCQLFYRSMGNDSVPFRIPAKQIVYPPEKTRCR